MPTPPGADPKATPDLTPEEVARLFTDQPSPNLSAADEATLRAYENMPAEADPMAGMEREEAFAGAEEQPKGLGDIEPEGTVGDAAQPASTAMKGEDTFVIPETFGPQAETLTDIRKDLSANPELLVLYVTDDRVRQVFKDIDELEKVVSVQPGVSLGLAREIFDRLAQARNFMLADRGYIEEAQRELAEARYRFARIQRMAWFEAPRSIFSYLVLVFIVLVVVLAATGWIGPIAEALVAGALELQNEAPLLPSVLGLAILSGGLGGVVGGLNMLWLHVADKKDFDPEFSMWYYAYPLIGFAFGLVMYLIARSNIITWFTDNQFVIYFVTFIFGFYQNLMVRLFNQILGRLFPKDEAVTSSETVATSVTTSRAV
ncbi:MAG: hypothetical protein ACT4QE_24260 [Anaerolineales bacterium]